MHLSACDEGLLKPSLFAKSSMKITLMFWELGEVGMGLVLWENAANTVASMGLQDCIEKP